VCPREGCSSGVRGRAKAAQPLCPGKVTGRVSTEEKLQGVQTAADSSPGLMDGRMSNKIVVPSHIPRRFLNLK